MVSVRNNGELESTPRAALVAYAVVVLAIYMRGGGYAAITVVFLFLALGILVMDALGRRPVIRRFAFDGRFATGALLPALLFGSLVLSFRPFGLYFASPALHLVAPAALVVALPFVASYFSPVTRWGREARAVIGSAVAHRFPILVALATLMRAFVPLASPTPVIDVWYMLNEGADALVRGVNPYTILITNPYVTGATTDGYIYPPLVAILTTPFRVLFGDVRWAFALCEVASAALLLRLATRSGGRRTAATELVVLLFFFHPRALHVLENAWTEPLSTTLFFGAVVLLREKRLVAASVLAGLFFASKQYFLFVAPLMLFPVFGATRSLRRTISCAVVAVLAIVAVTLPFFLWDPAAFINDVVGHHLKNPFRDDGLTVTSFLFHSGAFVLPPEVSLMGAGLALALGLWAHRRDLSVAGFATIAAMALLGALLFQKYALFNYYYFLGTMLVAAIAARVGEGEGESRHEAGDGARDAGEDTGRGAVPVGADARSGAGVHHGA